MILGIDIGNSNIVIGYIEKGKVMDVFRLETDTSMSVKEYSITIKAVMEDSKIDSTAFEGTIICSVVTTLTPVLSEVLHILTGFEPLILNSELKTGLNYSIESPEKLGSDRIADCVAAAAKYPLPAVVIDFGTATTFSVIGYNSVFLGGAIAPGLKTSVRALSQGTSQLSSISLAAPESCIGINTDECIKSGIVLGTASMVDGMIDRFEKQLETKVSIVATGGLAHLVTPHCSKKLIHDDNLLLQGLSLIFEMNKD